MGSLAVYVLFFLSGISGLVYQVVWVRLFGNVFGNTIYSASTVSAIFLCGLGVGSYLAGRWSDRIHGADPHGSLRAYGLFELGIGGLGLAIAFLLPVLGRLAGALAGYEVGTEGWHELTAGTHLIRFGAAALMLLPIALLMGGTLTLLIRHLVARDLDAAGWTIGSLYGINTAGAALGAFATDFALIPALGIFRTELVAVGINLGVGAAALVLARGGERRAPAPTATTRREVAITRPVVLTAAAIFLSGFAAMGVEILWLRYVISMLGGFRSVFSELLTVILVGIFLGSFLGGHLQRRSGRTSVLFFLIQTLFVASFLAQLAFFDRAALDLWRESLRIEYAARSGIGRLALEFWYNLRPIIQLVGLPALLMGFTFPLANAQVQRVEESVGSRAGILYLGNTAGNVTGSLLTGLVLLPLIGMQVSAALLAICAGAAIVPFHLAAREPTGAEAPMARRVLTGCAAVLALSLIAWVALPSQHLARATVRLLPGEEVLSVTEGINETIAVIDKPGVERKLFTNGHSMSSTSASATRYMRLFSHVPLLMHANPERVLVICFGVGNTADAATLHPSVTRVEAADLSRNVIEHAPWFGSFNHDVISNPKLDVFVNDGRHHLRMQPRETYDLITLEPPPLAYAGVNALFSHEFYALARSRLRPGGFMTQWLPVDQLAPRDTLAAIRAFLDVFPGAVLLSGYLQQLILLGGVDGAPQLDLAHVRARLAEQPALQRDLERIQVGTLTDLAGLFVADGGALERATKEVDPVTDDHPVMEYSQRSLLRHRTIPATIFDPSGVADWCPACFVEPAELAALPSYLGALHACYQGGAFLGRTPSGYRGLQLPRDSGGHAAIQESRYLTALFYPRTTADGLARGAYPCALAEGSRP